MDCVTEVVESGLSSTHGSQATVDGRLCCSDLMEISRRLPKCSEAREFIQRLNRKIQKKWNWAG